MTNGKPGRRRDHGQRIKAEVRKRYGGIHLYVPLEWLQAAGVEGNGSPLYYRLWAAPRGRLIVTLYREP
jgi:hypothetical protein